MTASYFITGTDTDVGKTFISAALLNAAAGAGYSTAAVKPLAAGGSDAGQGLQNEDALLLQQASTLPLSYEEVNPLCLKQAIAPHLAAEQQGIRIEAEQLAAYCAGVMEKNADLTLIEGAGGWLVPLNDREYVADIVKILDVPVILVVGMRLGCLNHALLTVLAMEKHGVKLHGWIANRLDPDMPCYEQNIESLRSRIKAPLLATLDWNIDEPSEAFELDRFLRE